MNYEEFHCALTGLNGRANGGSVMKTAREPGLKEDRLRADMNAPGWTRIS